MYLRHTTVHKDGKTHTYWRLVRSVRRGRKVVQETVAQLGAGGSHGHMTSSRCRTAQAMAGPTPWRAALAATTPAARARGATPAVCTAWKRTAAGPASRQPAASDDASAPPPTCM